MSEQDQPRKTRTVEGILHFLTREQMAEEIVRLDAILASRATRLAEAPKGWKPIETAPKDSTPVIVWWDDRAVGEARFVQNDPDERGAWWWANQGPGDYHAEALSPEPTHWMPLPPAPDAAPAASSPEAADERANLLDDARAVLEVIVHDAAADEFRDARALIPRLRAALASAPAGAGEGAMEQIIKLNEHSKAHMQALADLVCLAERQFKGHPGREWIDRDQAMRLVPVLRDNASAVDEIGRKLLRAALAGEPAVAAARPPKMPDEAIREWGERHDLRISGITDLRCAFDDAQTLHMAASQDEHQEKQG